MNVPLEKAFSNQFHFANFQKFIKPLTFGWKQSFLLIEMKNTQALIWVKKSVWKVRKIKLVLRQFFIVLIGQTIENFIT